MRYVNLAVAGVVVASAMVWAGGGRAAGAVVDLPEMGARVEVPEGWRRVQENTISARWEKVDARTGKAVAYLTVAALSDKEAATAWHEGSEWREEAGVAGGGVTLAGVAGRWLHNTAAEAMVSKTPRREMVVVAREGRQYKLTTGGVTGEDCAGVLKRAVAGWAWRPVESPALHVGERREARTMGGRVSLSVPVHMSGEEFDGKGAFLLYNLTRGDTDVSAFVTWVTPAAGMVGWEAVKKGYLDWVNSRQQYPDGGALQWGASGDVPGRVMSQLLRKRVLNSDDPVYSRVVLIDVGGGEYLSVVFEVTTSDPKDLEVYEKLTEEIARSVKVSAESAAGK